MSQQRIALLLVALCAAAVDTTLAKGNAPAADSRIIEEVTAVDIGVWNAANACDKDRWSALVADDVALITPYGFVLDKTRLLNSTTLRCNAEWKMEPVKVQVYGDAAVVVGNHTYTIKPGKDGHPGRYLYTRIYEKRNARWQWVFGQHQIITDIANGGDVSKEILTEQDKAVLRNWK